MAGRYTARPDRPYVWTALLLALAGVSLLAYGAGVKAPGPVPWPSGGPPTPVELRQLVDEAIELHDRERFEEFLEALESGEDSEHIFLLQERVDHGALNLDRLFDLGDALFEHEFRRLDGYGDAPRPLQQRVHVGVRGGLDTFSCAGCHSLGGPDGAGGLTQNAFVDGDGVDFTSAHSRNPPALLGLGLVQALAAEMTVELQTQRADAIRQADATGEPATIALRAKGIDFGSLTAGAGSGEALDLEGVRGVSHDLVVRPFGWKGEVARLRRFVEEAARIHFGIQSHPLAVGHRAQPDNRHLGAGPKWFDPDGDGVQRELEEGTLTATAVYLAMLETPVILPPRDPALLERWARGSENFDALGCNRCHTRSLLLYRNEWEERPDTTGGPPVKLRPLHDGDQPRGTSDVALFSDLRRHDMGPEMADPRVSASGVPASHFLTRPLWGLAESAPYLHDGRAPTISDAIRSHRGEAADSRDAYEAISVSSQVDLHIFLLSLTRQPKPRIPR